MVFLLILSQRWLRDKAGSFGKDFEDELEISLSMQDFIDKAKIDTIGIPVFIAHGGNENVDCIFEKMKKIKRISLFGLNIKYISISMPLIDKKEMMQSFAKMLINRRKVYESAAK